MRDVYSMMALLSRPAPPPAPVRDHRLPDMIGIDGSVTLSTTLRQMARR